MNRQRCFGWVVGLLFLLAGCGPAEDGDKVVLRVANWGGAKEGNEFDKLVEQIYRDFEKENPGVVIREESTPGSGDYVAKMALAYVADAQPDIMMLDLSSAAIFIEGGVVSDLTPFIEKDPDFNPNDFFPNVFNAARRGDKVYAIPQDFTPMVVYLNKRLFEKAGVAIPNGNWNFEEFREVARKLTIAGDRPNQGPKQYGFAFANWAPGWVMWLWNNGADHFSIEKSQATGYLNSPESVQAVTFLRDLVQEGLAPSLSQTASMGVDLFAEGRAAMTVSGHWSMISYKSAKGVKWEDLVVLPMPHNTPTSQSVMYQSGYSITTQSPKKELAWKFIKYMTSYKVQSLYQSSGIAVCARKDVAEERAKALDVSRAFLAIVPTCRPPYGAQVEGYAYVEEQMQKAMDSVLRNTSTPEEALGQAARRIDREFSKR